MKSSQHSQGRTCPWWLLFTFDNPLRRLIHNGDRLLKTYVQPGDTVLDVGCGMGYFSLPLARLVGEGGKVLAADLQPQMLEGLKRRAQRAGLLARIEPRLSTTDNLQVRQDVDFALAFWMIHEVRNPASLLDQISQCLKPGGKLLVVEPILHVNQRQFQRMLDTARSLGFQSIGQPPVRLSRAALLAR